MFPFRRKKRNQKPPEAWLKWMMFAFVGYAILSNSGKKHHEEPKTEVIESEKVAAEEAVKIEENKSEEFPDNPLTNPSKLIDRAALKGRLFPVEEKIIRWKDISVGGGDGAVCGQEASIKYREVKEKEGENSEVSTSIPDDAKFKIGSAEEKYAGFQVAIIGMQKGGKRAVLTKDGKKIEVELLDATPKIPDFSAFRMFGDVKIHSDGFECGKSVAGLNVKIWDVAGKKLYDGTPEFTIGKSESPLGLEQGVIGMVAGERRLLIIPPDLQKSLNGAKIELKDFPAPQKQTVIAEVSVTSVNP